MLTRGSPVELHVAFTLGPIRLWIEIQRLVPCTRCGNNERISDCSEHSAILEVDPVPGKLKSISESSLCQLAKHFGYIRDFDVKCDSLREPERLKSSVIRRNELYLSKNRYIQHSERSEHGVPINNALR